MYIIYSLNLENVFLLIIVIGRCTTQLIVVKAIIGKVDVRTLYSSLLYTQKCVSATIRLLDKEKITVSFIWA